MQAKPSAGLVPAEEGADGLRLVDVADGVGDEGSDGDDLEILGAATAEGIGIGNEDALSRATIKTR